MAFGHPRELMMLPTAGLILAVPLFFAAVYFCSRARGVRVLGWWAVGISSLVAIWASIVKLAIPDFFSKGL